MPDVTEEDTTTATPTKKSISTTSETPVKEGEENYAVEAKEVPTHWSKLDLKMLKGPRAKDKEKAEAEEKKLTEEQKKTVEKLEKEKEEKKAALEKHYTPHKERKVGVRAADGVDESTEPIPAEIVRIDGVRAEKETGDKRA
ncbi:hypothetical protein Aduo_011097 [Ancylostoma duodenale]